MKYCEEYAALLDAYVDGELPVEEVRRVQAHVDGCPGCRAYVADALAIRAAFPDVEDTAVPAGFADAVCAAVRAGSVPRKRRRAHWAKVLAPLAACCAIVVVLRTMPGRMDRLNDTLQPSVAAATADTAAPAEDTTLERSRPAGGENEDTAPAPAEDAADKAPLPDAAAQAAPETENQEEAAPAEDAAPEAMPFALGPAEETPPSDGGDSGQAAPAPTGTAGYYAAFTLTVAQAGDLLDALPPETPVTCDPATGSTRYTLTRDQFEALLPRLEETGVAVVYGDGGDQVSAFVLPPEN